MAGDNSVTYIRRGLPGGTVIDASVGADGNCNGGREGAPDSPIKPGSNPSITRGEDTILRVVNQSGIASRVFLLLLSR